MAWHRVVLKRITGSDVEVECPKTPVGGVGMHTRRQTRQARIPRSVPRDHVDPISGWSAPLSCT